MALIKCKECENEVSSKATKCTKCGVRLRKAKRGFFGKLAKWFLIIFNVLMILWILSVFTAVSELPDTQNTAEEIGAALGGIFATGMIITIWVIGDIILGIWAVLTKPTD